MSKMQSLGLKLCAPTLLIFLASSCGPRQLSSEGDVRLWFPATTEKVKETASSLDGLSLEIVDDSSSWQSQISTKNSPDLVLTEWGRDIEVEIAADRLLDLTPHWDRLEISDMLWQGFSRETPFFIPATVSTWGLFYNPVLLESYGISLPETWNELVSTLVELQEAGVTPVALGASSGWPALAWVSYIDLRLNGARDHAELLDGSRSFDDPSLIPVYTTLEEWRNAGFFGAEATSMTWTESLEAVRAGDAAFVLMGAFAVSRVSSPEPLRFMGVPVNPTVPAGDNGELALARVFVVPAGVRAPEAALSLADAYILSDSPDITSDGFSLPSIRQADVERSAPLLSIQADILERADLLIPQIDRYLGAQTAYDMSRLMRKFFETGSALEGADLARILKQMRP